MLISNIRNQFKNPDMIALLLTLTVKVEKGWMFGGLKSQEIPTH